MQKLTLSGIHPFLRRFGLRYKRGQQHVWSPDPLYDQKMAHITQTRSLAQQAPGHVVFLYGDEHSANVRPRVGCC